MRGVKRRIVNVSLMTAIIFAGFLAVSESPVDSYSQSAAEGPEQYRYQPQKKNETRERAVKAQFNKNKKFEESRYDDGLSDQISTIASRAGLKGSYTSSYGSDGSVNFTLSSQDDRNRLAAQVERFGLPLNITVEQGFALTNTMYNSRSPFAGNSLIRVNTTGEDILCTAGLPWNFNRWGGTFVTAGHCTHERKNNIKKKVQNVYTTNHNNYSNTAKVSNSSHISSLNAYGSSRKMSNGGYNGDIAILNVISSAKVRGSMFKSPSLMNPIPSVNNGAGATVGMASCWTGANSGKRVCGFRIKEAGVTAKVGGATYRPMMKMDRQFISRASCPIPGDSGGLITLNDNRVVGVISSVNYNQVWFKCTIMYTNIAQIKQAFPGKPVLDGRRVSG